jgi:hypothetical protein
VDTHHFDADPDSTYHPDADSDFLFDADPDPNLYPDADPDSSFQIKARTLEKVIKQAHNPYTFWLDFCNLKRIRIRVRIQLITLM